MVHFDKKRVLAALTGRYSDFYGQYTTLRSSGGELRGPCPIHQGDGQNFTVTPNTGEWYCFTQCQAGGDAINFIERLEGIDFLPALQRLAEWAGVAPSDAAPTTRPTRQATRQPPPRTKKPDPPAPTAGTPETACLDPKLAETLHQNLLRDADKLQWLLQHRGWTLETIKRFQIGLLPAQPGGVWRITFPVYDAEGRLINIRKHLFAYSPELTEERRRELKKTLPWDKGLSADLFPRVVIERAETILIVEGEADALIGNQLGIPTVTGTGGAASWNQRYTAACAGKEVVFLYDADTAGQTGVQKAIEEIARVAKSVKLARLPEGMGKDLTEFVVQHEAMAADLQAVIREAVGQRTLELTDVGNGERLAQRHGRDLRYCYAWEKWLIWDGQRWQKDDTGEIDRRAKETAQYIFQEAANCPDTAQKTELAKHALRSQSHARLQSMIALAKPEEGIPVRVSEWDKQAWLLACENGTVDLKTGKLRESRRTDMGTKRAGTKYDPEAAAPRWEAFLKTVLPDADVRAFFQRAAGYALTGDVSEQCLFFLYGSGSNGKSTALRALMDALGDYALQAAPDLLIAREGNGGPNNDVAELQGTRLVATIEVEDGKRMAEAVVKQITGGDRLKARFMRQDYFEFEPTHKIFLAANHKPTIRGQDVAIWRRIKVVPFTVQIADTDKDPHLAEKLRAEMPGILAWAVRGCLEWQRMGLAEPIAVKEATAAYRAAEDVLGYFLAECCVLQPHCTVSCAELYTAYLKWVEENSERPLSKKTFGTRLQEGRAITPKTGIGPKSARGWQGIGLLEPLPKPETGQSTSTDKSLTNDKSDPHFPIDSQLIKSHESYRENVSYLSEMSGTDFDGESFLGSYLDRDCAAKIRVLLGGSKEPINPETLERELDRQGFGIQLTRCAVKHLEGTGEIEHNGLGYMLSTVPDTAK